MNLSKDVKISIPLGRWSPENCGIQAEQLNTYHNQQQKFLKIKFKPTFITRIRRPPRFRGVQIVRKNHYISNLRKLRRKKNPQVSTK